MAVPAQEKIDNLSAQELIDMSIEEVEELEKERREQIASGLR